MKRVVHLTTVHPPFDTRIFHKQAKTLAAAGYEVTLIAQHDRDESVEGIRILALPTPRNRLARILRLTWKTFRLALQQHADVYHFHDPELLGMGLLLSIFTRGKVIYDVHEDVPRQILGKQWVPRLLRRPISTLFNVIEKVVSAGCDVVIPATESIARGFGNRQLTVIHNYPDLNMFLDRNTGREGDAADRLIYIGGISRKRGVVEMIAALNYLCESASVRLDLIGRFSSSGLVAETRLLPGFSLVDYRGSLPWHDAWEHAYGAIAGLVLFHPGPNHTEALPTKLFEYMAAGLPVIASDFPLWRGIVEGNACGLTVDPLNPEAIAEAVKYVLKHPDEAGKMGQNGRRAVEETYNWETESKKLLDLYERILS